MTFKEFGKIVEENKNPSFKEFGTVVEEPSRARSIAGAPIKGAIKKSADIAEFFTSTTPGKYLHKIPSPRELLGMETKRTEPEDIRKFAEKNFPTQEEELEKYLERAGGLGLEALLTPVGGVAGTIGRVATGAALGHAAEKLGAPEWAQAIAEGVPFFFSAGKKIPLKKSQKEFGSFLRKQGLTENEIAPLLKSESQLDRWSKWASKGSKSKELMESIYQKTSGMFDELKKTGKNLPSLNNQAKTDLLNSFKSIWDEIPNKFRTLIKADMQDFLTKGRGGAEDLINLYRDINATIGPESGGKAVIGLFKDPITKAMHSISPELTSDFKLTNQLYGTRANTSAHLLNKKQMDELIDLGEAMQFGGAVANRDLGKIADLIGISGARKIAREMLINPRLQNLSIRIGEAIKQNKYVLAEKYIREFKKESSKKDESLSE